MYTKQKLQVQWISAMSQQFTVCNGVKHRVQYCKLFNELVNRNISPLVLRLVLNMYTKHKLQVRWGKAMSQ